MRIIDKHLFILIGDDRTGKTTIQKYLVQKLCGHGYERLPVNVEFSIVHPEVTRKFSKASFGNRSYQEKPEYPPVSNYFSNHFKDADIAFISSHLVESDLQAMIQEARSRFFNVVGVFWANSIGHQQEQNAIISKLDWDKRLILDNTETSDAAKMERQLEQLAERLIGFIVKQ